MVQFDELQKLWQSQPPPAVDARALGDALGRYRTRQDRINTIKLAAILFCVATGAFKLRYEPALVCGMVLLGAAALLFLFSDWRNQRAIARLDFTQPSLAFVRAAAVRLSQQRQPFGRLFWLVLLIAGIILNWILLGALQQRPPLFRIVGHLLASAYPLLAYQFGKWVRARRFEAECRPLLDRLTALAQSLEEQAR